jgi:hypothetical protein
MIATASHSFEVKDLYLDQNRCFIIDFAHSFLDDPIYQLPFLQFAEATLAVNSSGMASRFLDLCETIFKQKTASKLLHQKPDAAKNALHAARHSFYSAVQSAWADYLLQKTVSPALLNKISSTSRQLALVSRRIVDELYPYCGMEAARPHTEINRVWRNLHTASQHGLLNFNQLTMSQQEI